MWEQLITEKGIGSIQFDSRDFKCEKELYDDIPLLLGYFEGLLSRKHHVGKIYSIAFGYPGRNKDEYEYYLLSEQEYHEFKEWPEKRQWEDTTEASRWMHKNLEGKRQLLCNDFRRRPTIYQPFFTLAEIPGYGSQPKTTVPPVKQAPPVEPAPAAKSKPTRNAATPFSAAKGFSFTPSKEFNQGLVPQRVQQGPTAGTMNVEYRRVSVCAADDYVNRDLTIKMPSDATVGDLVDYIQHYYDGESYSAIPYTGGGNWWTLESDQGVLAQVNDDGKGVRYNMSPTNLLRVLGITKVKGTRG